VTYGNAKDPSKLWAEIKAAEKARKERLSARKQRLARLVGPAGGPQGAQATEYEPENRLYEWLAYTLPKVTYSNPRWRVRSRRSGFSDAIAKAVQSAMNRLTVEQKLRRTLRANCIDYLMDWGPAMVVQEPKPGLEMSGRPVWWPQLYSIEPHVFFMDPLALRIDQAKFAGHTYLRDKTGLVEVAKDPENGWNLEAVQALTEEAGVEIVHEERGDVPARGEVALYEVWCPEMHGDLEEDPDDGFSGTLYTMGCYRDGNGGEEAYELRPPRAYYGPRQGPYSIASFLQIQDFPYGISPTIPAETQLKDLGETSRAMLNAAKRHKVMTTGPATDPDIAKKINDPDGWYIPILPGTGQDVRPLEIGGVSQQQLLHFEMKSNTLDRVLGMADAQRGVVTGEGTASEVMTAQQASDVRGSDVAQQFRDHVQDLGEMLAFFVVNDDRFAMEIDGMQLPGMAKPALRGGKSEGFKFDDLELEIEPFSMEHEGAAMRQGRIQRTIELCGWLAQMVPQAPWLPWKDIIPELVESAGLEEALSNIDVKAAVEYAAAMAGFEGKPQQDVKATSGRQSQGRPINVNVKAGQGRGPTSSSYGKGPRAMSPQRMGGGKQMQPGKGRVA
jgi:hypothetical protein